MSHRDAKPVWVSPEVHGQLSGLKVGAESFGDVVVRLLGDTGVVALVQDDVVVSLREEVAVSKAKLSERSSELNASKSAVRRLRDDLRKLSASADGSAYSGVLAERTRQVVVLEKDVTSLSSQVKALRKASRREVVQGLTGDQLKLLLRVLEVAWRAGDVSVLMQRKEFSDLWKDLRDRALAEAA